VAIAGAFAVLSLALGGASCDKKSAATPAPDPGPSVPFEEPKGTAAAASKPAAAPTPPPAPEAKVDPTRVAQLAGKLPSPCGKAESLERSLGDAGCKAGPFARRFLEYLVGLGASDEEVEELYRNRFGPREARSFNLRETPFSGTANAPVAIVEFYDYQCPHCREAAPVLEQVVAAHPRDVTLYYKQYPLRKESMDMARGALAAHRQGKFHAVHAKLFDAHGREDVLRIAEGAGLDMAQFRKDLDDPGLTAKINADKDEAQKAKLQGTPTIFVNDRMYMDGFTVERFGDWIEEELAVNR
jgi:predicted DsbA family dithiol-disulfide isomerase